MIELCRNVIAAEVVVSRVGAFESFLRVDGTETLVLMYLSWLRMISAAEQALYTALKRTVTLFAELNVRDRPRQHTAAHSRDEPFKIIIKTSFIFPTTST